MNTPQLPNRPSRTCPHGQKRGVAQAKVLLYDRLFTQAHPEADGKGFLEHRNPDSLTVVRAYVEPSLAGLEANE